MLCTSSTEVIALLQESDLPRISRIDYYTCDDDRLVHSVAAAIHADAIRRGKWPDQAPLRALFAWSRLTGNVTNGGFQQFFLNNRGDLGVAELIRLLTSLEFIDLPAIIEKAADIYRRNRDKFQPRDPCEKQPSYDISEFEPLHSEFARIDLKKVDTRLSAWARSRIRGLVIGDDTRPIDSQFSGTIEVHRPDGELVEDLEVKDGKAHGVYHEYFEDGTVRVFKRYEAGKALGDYWPTGQIQKLESDKNGEKTIEWFYPSGKLQKQIFATKDGLLLRPAQLFHENGQLAEEMFAELRKNRGPWVKFFDDGSPQLQAQFTDKGELIVHNAWDDQRREVVKNGSGIFDDDGRRIHSTYRLFFEGMWRTVSELEGGVCHGKKTIYHQGVLWGVDSYLNGTRNGISTSYWDNGRIRRTSHYENGKEVRSESFAKFDHPMPAVVLEVEANEKLYKSWNHIPVDEYPVAQNAEEIAAEFRLPQFLIDVCERNRAGAPKSRYEDWNTFRDGITYILSVDHLGEVAEAKANGSGTYSGRDWDTYLPLIRRLRFSPARVGGKPMNCQVIARVEHTFVEGK